MAVGSGQARSIGIRRWVSAAGALLLGATLTAVPLSGAAAQQASGPMVEVSHLTVNGRADKPLGLDDATPVFGWRMRALPSSASHPCMRAGGGVPCPADRQSAYQIQVSAADGERLWDTGKVASADQTGVRYDGRALESRQRLSWRVQVWDADGQASEWSQASRWETGLLDQADWGPARWIEYPGRTENQPMPIFARQFDANEEQVAKARLYLSGVGLHHATVNGESLTDEVLAPGYSNYQLSSEYRTYDVTDELTDGANTVGVQLGNGTAYVRRSVTNPAVGRTSPYAWWQSQLKGSGTLEAAAAAGDTSVKVSSTTGYHVGGTINIDTGDGGDRLESRVITAIGSPGADGTGISVEPGLSSAHAAGALVTGSGNNIAASDPSAGAAVTPRLIARLEIAYDDGNRDVIVSDRSWRTALGPLVTDAWYSGSDFDARREQPGWDEAGSDLSATATRRDGTPVGWTSAGIAPAPNLATKLVARDAEPVKVVEKLRPVSVTEPVPGTYVFDFGQNFSGFPQLNLNRQVAAGTTIRMTPAESLNADGTVNQSSIAPTFRGRDVLNSYTTAGTETPESWRPHFNYFGMQWVQVTGLPEGYDPTADLITGLRVQGSTPNAGEFTSSNTRINRIHKMVRYSFASNIISVFTDCPGREKLSYPADYTMVMGSIHRDHTLAAYMRTTMRHLVEGQSLADTPMHGNVALKTPVYDWGYQGRFGDEINWGDGIVLVPWFLYEYYGDTDTMATYYDEMVDFADYIQREKAGAGGDEHIVDAALADWASAEQTSGRITGTWGYFTMISKLARMAELTGHDADAERYWNLADDIKQAFNAEFYNESLDRYTADGNAGTTGATQAAQALSLDAGLVPEGKRDEVLDALVELVYAYHPEGAGPHFSGGTIGMAPIVRALTEGGRDDVLWDLLQEDDYPSYGYFMEPTAANPEGFTTIGERWTRGDSKNHMILAQIEEWFYRGLAGIRAADGSTAYREVVIQPKIVGDLTHVKGTYESPHGVVSSEWHKDVDRFDLRVQIPANTSAEVWVPRVYKNSVSVPRRATFLRVDGSYDVYAVGSGSYSFASAGAPAHTSPG